MKKFNARRKLKVHVMCSSVIKSTRAWLEGILGYFKQPTTTTILGEDRGWGDPEE